MTSVHNRPPSHHRCLHAAGLLGFALLAAAPAHAGFVVNGSGLTGPYSLLDFESVALVENQVVSNQFQAAGVIFSNAFGNPDPTNYPNLSGNRIGNFQGGIGNQGVLTMDFASVLDSAAFALVSAIGGNTTFQAYLDGNLVESATAATSTNNSSNYYAFTGIQFNRVTISVVSFDDALMIDNLQTVASLPLSVPEPGSLALVMASVGALALVRRRRTRR